MPILEISALIGFLAKAKGAAFAAKLAGVSKPMAITAMHNAGAIAAYAQAHATTLATITAGVVMGAVLADIAENLATLVQMNQMSQPQAREYMKEAERMDKKEQEALNEDLNKLITRYFRKQKG